MACITFESILWWRQLKQYHIRCQKDVVFMCHSQDLLLVIEVHDVRQLRHVCTDSAYELPSGERVPFSILGSMSTDLSVPYSPADFPFDSSAAASGACCSPQPITHAAALLAVQQSNTSTAAVPAGAECDACRAETSVKLNKAQQAAASDAESTPLFQQVCAACELGCSTDDDGAAGEELSSREHHTTAADVDCPRNAHFLAMCAKLIYEDERIVRDVIENRCTALQTSPHASCPSMEGKSSRIQIPYVTSRLNVLIMASTGGRCSFMRGRRSTAATTAAAGCQTSSGGFDQPFQAPITCLP